MYDLLETLVGFGLERLEEGDSDDVSVDEIFNFMTYGYKTCKLNGDENVTNLLLSEVTQLGKEGNLLRRTGNSADSNWIWKESELIPTFAATYLGMAEFKESTGIFVELNWYGTETNLELVSEYEPYPAFRLRAYDNDVMVTVYCIEGSFEIISRPFDEFEELIALWNSLIT